MDTGFDIPPPPDDAIRPFQVDALDIRGRTVRLGPTLDSILTRHAYPTAVSRLLGEAIVLAALLGSSLKIDGKFILQTKTDGAVSMLVVDYRTSGAIRAHATFDAERVASLTGASAPSPAALLGRGILAMTVDQGPATSRYQGVVQLDGANLEDVAHAYFRQSEQIPTRVRLAVAESVSRVGNELQRGWRAGGLIAQFLPTAVDRVRLRDLPGGDAPPGLAPPPEIADDNAWTEARSLVSTIEDHELIDPALSSDRLLYRLFHAHGVRVFDAGPVRDECSCTRERIDGILRSFTAEEIEESVEDAQIKVTCEFCGSRYTFDPENYRPGQRAAG